ncbi:MAG TPA: FAD-dependent oxidoreductase [Vicinamibacteria bacterium]|nr:FAD-dependent oxidoreductase [Vicinamibacteria bacterium]
MRHELPESSRVAVIGGGVSGLTAAYLMSKRYEVTLFEAAPRIGGHTFTVPVETERGVQPVDMGFIVFNEPNYPNFVRLMSELGVESRPSEMSFSVRVEASGLEYRATSLDTLFAQRRNLLSPSFHHMLADILRFRRHSRDLLVNGNGNGNGSGRGPTLDEYVRQGGYSRAFWENFLMPMGSAIWSATPEVMERFPAAYLAQFFHHHGFLETSGAPAWRTLVGGSKAYLEPITRPFAERIRLGEPVRAVRRFADRVEVRADSGTERFDHVFIAAHSDEALAMLADPSPVEVETLGAIPYQPNDTSLHTDERFLPRNVRARASWNYVVPKSPSRRANVTYYSNRLQGIDSTTNFLVTLNRNEDIRAESVRESVTFHHPIYSAAGVGAQKRFSEMNGCNRTSYCGAYWGFGFHEDGVASAVEAVKPYGVGL